MALVEVTRFHTLAEAEVAASLLRSAGIETSVADAHYGSVLWIEQRALGGYRLSVADTDLADTLAILRHLPEPEPLAMEDVVPPSLGDGDRVAATAAMLTLGPAGGWLFTRGRRSNPLALVVVGLLMLSVAVFLVMIGAPYAMTLLGLYG